MNGGAEVRHMGETTPAHTAFATPEWFDAWLVAFGGDRAGIWRASDAMNACAIPYRLERLPVGALTVPAALGATNDHTPRYDILGRIAEPGTVFNRMMSDLGVSMLSFDYLSEQSHLLRLFRARPVGLLYHVDFCEDSPYVNCRMSWDDYWIGLGSIRSLWARRERKLINEHGAVFSCLSSWQDVAPLLPRIYDVEASGWKGREGTAIKQRPETLNFYDTCVRHWAESNLLRLFTLSIRDEIAAFQINVLHGGVLTQLKVGYEEKFSKLSPGQVLQLQLLRWAFASPDVLLYDMLGGGGKAKETKRKWATDVEPLFMLHIFRRDALGLLAWARFAQGPRIKAWLTGKTGKTHQPIHPRSD